MPNGSASPRSGWRRCSASAHRRTRGNSCKRLELRYLSRSRRPAGALIVKSPPRTGGRVISGVWYRVLWRVALVAAALALCCPGAAPAEEVTGAADNLRTGWYPDEPSLAPASVTESAFAQAVKTALKG